MATNAKPVYKRILLKLSGEALQGSEGFGIDASILDRMAQEIKELVELGIQVGVVIGGGNLFRGAGLAKAGMNRVVGDHMGMLATVMNGLAMRDALHRAYVNARLMSAIPLNGVCDNYSWAEAISLLRNRAPAKVQSALLEAMQERQVTISENTYRLPSPFLVMATQNPIEQEGTYPLPEAQVDRFMLKVIINYPKKEEEKLIIRQNISGVKPDIKPILTKEEILEARKVVREVYLDEKIERYIVDIVFATRFPQEHGLANLANMISFGASPRASISLALAARAYAFIKRRGYVIPEDIRAVCHDVMRHRIGLSYEAEANNLTSEEVISEILNKVEVP